MSTYLGQVQAVMEEFDTLMPVSTDVERQQEHRQTLLLVLTLAGLPPDNDSVRDHILVSLTVPTIDESFSRLFRLAAPLFSHLKPLKSVHISLWRIGEGEDVLENLDPSVVIVTNLDTLVTYVIFCMVHNPVMILLF